MLTGLQLILGKVWAKLSVWLAVAGAIILVLAGVFVKGERAGRKAQSLKDAAKDAKARVEAARNAQEAYTDASDAAQKVREDAAKVKPADPVKRDDFDTTQ